MHDAPQDVLVEAYPEEEFWQDLLEVADGITNEPLARLNPVSAPTSATKSAQLGPLAMSAFLSLSGGKPTWNNALADLSTAPAACHRSSAATTRSRL
jgi:hypothetical protein